MKEGCDKLKRTNIFFIGILSEGNGGAFSSMKPQSNFM